MQEAETTQRMTDKDELTLQTARAVIAHSEGKKIQVKYSGSDQWDDWVIQEFPEPGDGNNYRPKPQPKRVHWSKPEHVPGPVCWVRRRGQPACWLITCVCDDAIYFGSTKPLQALFRDLPRIIDEYSTDRINWHPCTVEEQ